MEPSKWRLGTTFSSFSSSSEPTSPTSSSGDKSSNLLNGRLVEGNLLYRHQGQLSIGQINRFIVQYDTKTVHSMIEEDEGGKYLWIRVRNVEFQFFRPIYFTGPFSFYIDVTPYNFDHKQNFDEPIEFNNDIKPGQSFKAKLRINDNSFVENGVYQWTIDVVSQLAMTTKFILHYDFMIGYDYKLLRKVGQDTKPPEDYDSVISVQVQDTKELWTKPPRLPDAPVHLVVITHGIFSNVGADMLYIKEKIEKVTKAADKSNVIVRGYDGNVGKSEKGIRFLGKRVAKFVLDLCDNSKYRIDRISFVGHSLGGPVQAYAIAYIVISRPDFFKNIQPINFVNLAGPFLGILSEFPIAISLALDIGALGRTGRDLTLSHRFPSLIKKRNNKETDKEDIEINRKLTSKPILEVILDMAHETFESFQNRTVYANAINDGIVPLRTSALLYLDWKGLGDINKLKKKFEEETIGQMEEQRGQHVKKGSVGEIPEYANDDMELQKSKPKLEKTDTDLSYVTASNIDPNEEHVNVSDTNLRKPKFIEPEKTTKTSSSLKNQVGKTNNPEPSRPSTSSLIKRSTVLFTNSPKKLSKRKKIKKYVRIQTRSKDKPTGQKSPNETKKKKINNVANDNPKEDDEEAEEEWIDVQKGDDEMDDYNIPPAASTFLSAANVMLSPPPNQDYLMNPDKRAPSIFHDKRYNFDDLPPPHYTSKINLLKNHRTFKNFIKRDKNAIEEKIARSWHKDMEWRKILVTLKPDAHNNIAVRRKYSNAFGWEVIDHLVENHFGDEAAEKEKIFMRKILEAKTDSFNTKLSNGLQ
ncbi:putative lipase [Wickerhamomyces ciferrii]|uniref:Lipase n=1 Tax=Wickerhamomyces ciferrii (strain ATCC 14091 / BCRC 22168 / CBS 111 / JCM 3599 / NBRC 0793 / NRRL Y-1031 F-60-10) TaxID=1206466 RepID=K0KF42_WICCF|nr:putative lipase [Wickerhamomyces ciferrii]CCH40832.1 putative lipase [Wickerhamomyces ciferrii]